MRVVLSLLTSLVLVVVPVALARAAEKGAKQVPAVLNFKMKGLDNKDVDLSQYQGKVVLLVNVASQCGYTPQYKGLETLHEKYAREGLVIVGVPSNDFGQQEPGSNEEIASFCQKNYGVQFKMLSKVDVVGENQVPLYKYLTSKETNARFSGPIQWNFTKFLIGRDGEILGRFEPDVKPESPKMIEAIKAALAKK
jgi:glutathione peroxidase